MQDTKKAITAHLKAIDKEIAYQTNLFLQSKKPKESEEHIRFKKSIAKLWPDRCIAVKCLLYIESIKEEVII